MPQVVLNAYVLVSRTPDCTITYAQDEVFCKRLVEPRKMGGTPLQIRRPERACDCIVKNILVKYLQWQGLFRGGSLQVHRVR